MNKITMLALAGAMSAAFSAGSAFASGEDTSYQSLSDKASADYKSAAAQCANAKGNPKQVCLHEAKVARARTHADAVAQYKNTPADLGKARSELANAEYDLAKTKCGDLSASAKADCLRDAKSAQSAALVDAKAGTQTASLEETKIGTQGSQNAGIQPAVPASDMTGATATAGSTPAGSTADEARGTAGAAKNVVADTVITTKLKADLVRDPDLKAMDVHVETVRGVVMLSGFVPSKEQADKAEQLARGIDGVSDVKSALKVAPSKE